MHDIEAIPLALAYSDVLIRPAYSEVLPKDARLETTITPRIELSIPLLSSAMDTVTEWELAAALARQGGLGVIHKNFPPAEQASEVERVKQTSVGESSAAAIDARGRLRCAAAIGVGADIAARLDPLVDAGVDAIVVDTAHGHSAGVLAAVAEVRRRHPELDVIAGNVATAEAVVALAQAGAHAVKVGIGPGSICTTRLVAGVGIPQFSAVWTCAGAARAYGIAVIADGGIAESGDIVKALAAGAAAVMVGSLLAGTDESPGEPYERHGQRYKVVRGMGSLGAMRRGSRDRYFQADATDDKLVPEGVEGLVPVRGPVAGVVHRLMGGVRAGMGYVGAATLAELAQKARFVRISGAGRRESQVHDILFDP